MPPEPRYGPANAGVCVLVGGAFVVVGVAYLAHMEYVQPHLMAAPKPTAWPPGSQEDLIALEFEQISNLVGMGNPKFNPKHPKWANIGKGALVLLPIVID